MNRSLVPMFFFLAVVMAGTSVWALREWSSSQQLYLASQNALVHEEQQRLTEALDSWRTNMVEQLVSRAEQQLQLLPLPLSDLSALELRELDPGLARWEEGPVTGLVVNLNPASRQFYFQNREIQSDFMYLVAGGSTLGPTAEGTEDGYYFLVAAPLSVPDWAMVAQVDSSVGQAFFNELRPKGYASLEQRSGAFESMRLLRYGELSGTPETLIHPKFPEWRLRFHPSSTLVQYAVPPDPSMRKVGIALAAGALLMLLACVGLTVYFRRQSQDEESEETVSTKPAFKPAATQSYMASEVQAKQSQEETKSVPAFTPVPAADLPVHLFRANDIRGLAESELTPEFARHLGRAFATYCIQRDQEQVYVCRDARNSSEALCKALILGLTETGCNVVDMGLGPTPLLTHTLAHATSPTSGVMITGSHNPADYNGFKLFCAGDSVFGDEIQALRELMLEADYEDGEGTLAQKDFTKYYLKSIRADLPKIPAMRVVVDGGNGSAGTLCVNALRALECTTRSLYCEPDGNFPNHGPDPCKKENLKDLCKAVRKEGADFGVALDGDGDRVVIVDDRGEAVDPDRLFMLFAREALISKPGSAVVFDVKASRRLPELILRWGGRPIMERAGRTFIKYRVQQEHAILGGELSSHYFFGDRWSASDDGIYAACRLAAILLLHNSMLSDLLAEFDLPLSTPEISLPVGENEKTQLLERFREIAEFSPSERIEIDGLRVEYPHGWGLIRVSNTGPNLSLRFEAESEQALERIKDEFRRPLKTLLDQQELNF